LGIAGLWSAWKSSDGWIDSYTMLTVNADQHELMQNFHQPGDEKRMVVILPEDQYGDWLEASSDQARDLMREYPAGKLQANGAVTQPTLLF
jgi:putative SOS response-associated peptidase YedK